jgi:hypothetical protein
MFVPGVSVGNQINSVWYEHYLFYKYKSAIQPFIFEYIRNASLELRYRTSGGTEKMKINASY